MTRDFKLLFLPRAYAEMESKLDKGRAMEKNVSMTIHGKMAIIFLLFLPVFLYAFKFVCASKFYTLEWECVSFSLHEKHIRVVNDLPRVWAFFYLQTVESGCRIIWFFSTRVAQVILLAIRDVICVLYVWGFFCFSVYSHVFPLFFVLSSCREPFYLLSPSSWALICCFFKRINMLFENNLNFILYYISESGWNFIMKLFKWIIWCFLFFLHWAIFTEIVVMNFKISNRVLCTI